MYLFDTNILLILSRKSTSQSVGVVLGLTNQLSEQYVSIVTIGELNAFAKKRRLGKQRIKRLEALIAKLQVLDISDEGIIDAYGDIDSYSQNTLKERPSGLSARNMGKNDLWIAATAARYNLTLITTDKDFDHLSEEFLELKWIDPLLL